MARKQYAFILQSKRGDSRYFTIEEGKETISASRLFDKKAKRTNKTLYTYKSGATYEGEWIGGFRDGFGI